MAEVRVGKEVSGGSMGRRDDSWDLQKSTRGGSREEPRWVGFGGGEMSVVVVVGWGRWCWCGVLGEALLPHDLGKKGKNIYKKMKATVNSLQARISP